MKMPDVVVVLDKERAANLVDIVLGTIEEGGNIDDAAEALLDAADAFAQDDFDDLDEDFEDYDDLSDLNEDDDDTPWGV